MGEFLLLSATAGTAAFAADDWIAAPAIAVLWIAWKYLRDDSGLPILPMAMTFQWVQVTAGMWYKAATGREIATMYLSDYRPMMLIGLGCVASLVVGLVAGVKTVRRTPSEAEAERQAMVPGSLSFATSRRKVLERKKFRCGAESRVGRPPGPGEGRHVSPLRAHGASGLLQGWHPNGTPVRSGPVGSHRSACAGPGRGHVQYNRRSHRNRKRGSPIRFFPNWLARLCCRSSDGGAHAGLGGSERGRPTPGSAPARLRPACPLAGRQTGCRQHTGSNERHLDL